MISKKGFILHFITIGILAAIGLIVLSSIITEPVYQAKGEWQFTFLSKKVYPTETVLSTMDLVVEKIITEQSAALAAKGGFVTSSKCGTTLNWTHWNAQDQFCFPNLEASFNQTLPLQLKDEFQRNYTIQIIGEEVVGIPDDQRVFTNQTYSVTAGFRVRLPSVWVNLTETEQEAQRLVHQCKNVENLSNCLNTERLPSWHYFSCYIEVPLTESRQVGFCVDGEIDLKFILDFTSTAPFGVVPEVSPVNTDYLIQFPVNDAERYHLYYTDWPEAENKTGSVDQVYPQGITLASRGYLDGRLPIPLPLVESCTPEEVNQPYLCEGYILFQLHDEHLQENSSYFFAVTQFKNGKESPIVRFVSSTT